MTEKELRGKVVKTAQAYLGCKESDGSHRKIIDGYNAHKPLARGLSGKVYRFMVCNICFLCGYQVRHYGHYADRVRLWRND